MKNTEATRSDQETFQTTSGYTLRDESLPIHEHWTSTDLDLRCETCKLVYAMRPLGVEIKE